MLTVQTPFAEVLTVVSQQMVAVFPHSRTCAANYFITIETRRRFTPHPQWASICELRQRNLFDRPSAQAAREPSVLEDPAWTGVNTVMSVASAWCDDVRAQRRTLTGLQRLVAIA
jgi:hypothetical protein